MKWRELIAGLAGAAGALPLAAEHKDKANGELDQLPAPE